MVTKKKKQDSIYSAALTGCSFMIDEMTACLPLLMDDNSEELMQHEVKDGEEMSGMKGNINVAVPTGTIRIKAKGASYRYAHGGASLQEMIIPVLHSRNKDENKKEKVGVTILGQKLNMVSSRLKFKVIQSEAVDMNTVARTIVCAVYDGDTPVTAEKLLLLNSTDAVNFNNRIFEIELTLSKPVTSRLLSLRIYDENDRLNPLAKANVTNSTLIEPDF